MKFNITEHDLYLASLPIDKRLEIEQPTWEEAAARILFEMKLVRVKLGHHPYDEDEGPWKHVTEKHFGRAEPYLSYCPPQMSKISKKERRDFFASWEWLTLRAMAEAIFIKKCLCCGTVKNLQLDHIYPISLYPEKKLDPGNLQYLCKRCNSYKSNRFVVDFRIVGLSESPLMERIYNGGH